MLERPAKEVVRTVPALLGKDVKTSMPSHNLLFRCCKVGAIGSASQAEHADDARQFGTFVQPKERCLCANLINPYSQF